MSNVEGWAQGAAQLCDGAWGGLGGLPSSSVLVNTGHAAHRAQCVPIHMRPACRYLEISSAESSEQLSGRRWLQGLLGLRPGAWGSRAAKGQTASLGPKQMDCYPKEAEMHISNGTDTTRLEK